MTDGIVQKVLEKFKTKNYVRYINDSTIKELQQELIEKIQKEFIFDGQVLHGADVKKILIGDNE